MLFMKRTAFICLGVVNGCGDSRTGGSDSQDVVLAIRRSPTQAPSQDAAGLPQSGTANQSGSNTDKGSSAASHTPASVKVGKRSIANLTAAAAAFELPARDFETPSHFLWATFYRTPRFESQTSGYPLLDLNGVSLGPKLSQRQWCDAAMEGSVQVYSDGRWKTFNYSGSTGSVQVDCSPYFKHPVGRTRFKVARGPFGDGVQNFVLSPYRTIAVDPAVIPYGTVIYIESARGLPFRLPDGTQRRHDGYFYAADTGGLIQGNHIDVFIGIDAESPFAWITSKPSSRIEYQEVPDSDLRDVLRSLHL